jgi:rhodanese-related sulfurtransferase
MKPYFSSLLLSLGLSLSTQAAEVNITKNLASVDIKHQGKTITIEREQDTFNSVTPDFAMTSRPCPPFCIMPMQVATGVETIGELEVLNYLKKSNTGDDSILVIDSRTADWVAKGTIPGSINIPWSKLSNTAGSADPLTVTSILTDQFAVKELDGLFDFADAKTLVMFCNGPWCGQSPANIKSLLRYGYPAEKIKWYRGGMQMWAILGLTTVNTKIEQ